MIMQVNSCLLLEYITSSINYISTTFFKGQRVSQLQQLLNSATNCPHNIQVAIFFLLLNVDIELKEKIYNMEVEYNHNKLTRFFSDLRDTLVNDFLVSEKKDTLWFVSACRDGYIIA